MAIKHGFGFGFGFGFGNRNRRKPATEGLRYLKETISYGGLEGSLKKSANYLIELFIEHQEEFDKYDLNKFIMKTSEFQDINMSYISELTEKTILKARSALEQEIKIQKHGKSEAQEKIANNDFKPHVRAYANKVAELKFKGKEIPWEKNWNYVPKQQAKMFLSHFLDDVKPNERYFFKKGKAKLEKYGKMCHDIYEYASGVRDEEFYDKGLKYFEERLEQFDQTIKENKNKKFEPQQNQKYSKKTQYNQTEQKERIQE